MSRTRKERIQDSDNLSLNDLIEEEEMLLEEANMLECTWDIDYHTAVLKNLIFLKGILESND